MNKVLYAHVRMVLVVALVCGGIERGTMRLYYHGKGSTLSSKRVTPTSWVSTKRNATHYVDIPAVLVVGTWECTGMDYSTGKHVMSYDVYKLKGSANRYAKRSCREVV